MEQLTLNIKRQSSFTGMAMPYRIYINGVEMATIKNGGSVSLQIPNQQSVLKVSMVGNSMTFHSVEKDVVIFPEYCKSNVINCEIVTNINWIGALSGGLFGAVGKLVININY